MLRHASFDLLHHTSPGDAKHAMWLQKASQVVQIQIIRAVIDERIDRHDGVEELRGERQRSRIRVDRKHAVGNIGIPYALKVVRGGEPQIGRPDLNRKFAAQEDR
jgi:hypothetical protein